MKTLVVNKGKHINFLSPEKILFNAKSSNIYWFKEADKIMRCKGKKVFRDRKFLIEYEVAEEIKYICCGAPQSKAKAIELGIPIKHPREVYANYKW